MFQNAFSLQNSVVRSSLNRMHTRVCSCRIPKKCATPPMLSRDKLQLREDSPRAHVHTTTVYVYAQLRRRHRPRSSSDGGFAPGDGRTLNTVCARERERERERLRGSVYNRRGRCCGGWPYFSLKSQYKRRDPLIPVLSRNAVVCLPALCSVFPFRPPRRRRRRHHPWERRTLMSQCPATIRGSPFIRTIILVLTCPLLSRIFGVIAQRGGAAFTDPIRHTNNNSLAVA